MTTTSHPSDKGGFALVFIALLIIALLIGSCSEQGAARGSGTDDPEAVEAAEAASRSQAVETRRVREGARECEPFDGWLIALSERDQGEPLAICQRSDLTVVVLAPGDRDRRWWLAESHGTGWRRVGPVATRPVPREAVAPAPAPAPDPPPVPDRDPYVPPPPPPPVPDPEPYVPPPAPDPAPDPYAGYTGPRCYAPGGQTWTPC